MTCKTNMKNTLVRYAVLILGVSLMAVSCSSPLGGTTANVGGVFRSSNFGADWELLDRAVLAETTDGQNTKEEKTLLATTGVTFLRYSPENKQRLYAGTVSKGLYYSDDGGDRWKNILTNFIPHSIVVDPAQVEHVYVAGKSEGRAKVLESFDRGKSWNEIYQDAQENNSARGIAINPNNSQVLVLALLSGHIIRSTDAGKTWNVVAVISDRLKRLEWSASGLLYLLGEQKGVFVSRDGGLSFAEVSKVLYDQKLWDPYFGLERNSDNARGVQVNVPSAKVSSFKGFAVPDVETGALYLGTDVGLFVSYNSGSDWSFLPLPLRPNTKTSVQAVGYSRLGGEVYATVGNVVYYSESGGQSWQVQGIATTGIINYILVDPELPQQVFAGVVGETY